MAYVEGGISTFAGCDWDKPWKTSVKIYGRWHTEVRQLGVYLYCFEISVYMW